MSRIWMFLGSQCSMTRRRCSPSEDWPELCEQESKHKNAIWGLRGRRHWPDDGARCSCWWAWSERTIRFLATAQRRGCSSGPLALLHFVAASGRGERVVVAVDDDDGPTTAANFASACLFRIFMFSAITYLKTQAKLTHSLLERDVRTRKPLLKLCDFLLSWLPNRDQSRFCPRQHFLRRDSSNASVTLVSCSTHEIQSHFKKNVTPSFQSANTTSTVPCYRLPRFELR